MQKLLFILVLFFHFQNLLFAQNSGISVELHYPLTMPAEKNNYSDVNGFFGMGFQFQFTDNEVLNYGIEYKFDLNQTYQRYDYGSSQTDSFNFMMITSTCLPKQTSIGHKILNFIPMPVLLFTNTRKDKDNKVIQDLMWERV